MKKRLTLFVTVTLALAFICPACTQLWTPYNDPGISAQVKQAMGTADGIENANTWPQNEYEGIATMNIEYWDYDASGNLIYQKSGTYQRAVKIFVSRPKICGSISESSPFHLAIDTDMNPANPVDGDFSIYSGGSFSHPSGGCVMLQYWQLTGDESSFQGVLTDTHSAEANMRNMLWTMQQIAPVVDMVSFSSIDKGATLQGMIDGQKAQIRVEGNSVSRARPFSADIVAYRQ